MKWEITGYTGGDFTQTCTISANPASHTNKTYCFLATGLVKVSDISLFSQLFKYLKIFNYIPEYIRFRKIIKNTF